MISKAGMALINRVSNKALIDTCTIYRPPDPVTATRKPSGAIADAYPTDWQTVASGVKCRIAPSRLSGVERMGAGAVQATDFYSVAFARNTVIDATCRLRITASVHNSQLVGMDFDVKDAPLVSYPAQRLIKASKTLF